MSLAHLSILVIDVGGSHIKMMHNKHKEEFKFSSGKKMTPQKMVNGVLKATQEWKYDVISIGCPMPVRRGTPIKEPANLGKGWVNFNYAEAFGCPIKLINDAAMQALGDYHRGKMLFLGFGTGLGSTLIQDGIIIPLELGHLPFKRKTFEDYAGRHGLEKHGPKKWSQHVHEVIEIFQQTFQPEEIVLGGGNATHIKSLPSGCKTAANANAFLGGFRMWHPPYDQMIMTHQAALLDQNLYK